jgi:hypothetical protein
MTTKEEFLTEHNRLSPLNMQATKELLVRFYGEKRTLFKDDDWSLEKIRRPFIMWLTSIADRDEPKSGNRSGWQTFPRRSD